jgi:hypothetical protein
MKKLITLVAVMLISAPALAGYNLSNSDYTSPYADDAWTMALWHMDQTSGDTAALDSASMFDSHDTPHRHDAAIYLGLNDGWNTGNMELDPTKTWAASMTGFGNAATSWWVSISDSNIGPLRAEDPFHTLANPQSAGKDYTYEWWMKPDGPGGGWGSRVLKAYTGGPFNLNYQNSNISLGWYAPGGWYSIKDTTTAIAANDWTHIAVTIDCTSDTDTALVRFWHNGVNTYSYQTQPGKTFGNWPTNFVVMLNDGYGSLYSARQYTGQLDEVRISNTMRFIPEPTTLSLLAVAALAFLRKRK